MDRREEEKRLGEPYFIGLSPNGRWSAQPPQHETFEGLSAKKLLRGAWYPALIKNPLLLKDSDQDGLTDRVENRIGTNPHRSDTDGDGALDGVDPWPNAPLRDLTEEEQIIAAIFKKHFGTEKNVSLGLFQAPSGTKPFEMVGCDGITIWNADAHNKLRNYYELGIAFIKIGRDDDRKGWQIEWNPEHTIATVENSVYYGGKAGSVYVSTVQKVDGVWTVTKMLLIMMS